MSLLLNSTLNGIEGLVIVFIVSELGQRLNNAFEEIDLTIEQFDWYIFPIEIQRMLPMIIANAQQTVSLECFGSIACAREVFKNVSSRAIKKQYKKYQNSLHFFYNCYAPLKP